MAVIWLYGRWGFDFINIMIQRITYPVLLCTRVCTERYKQWYTESRTKEELHKLLQDRERAYDALRAEYIVLRAIQVHGYRTQYAETLSQAGTTLPMIAQVLMRRCSDTIQELVLDLGSRDGVAVDMVAIVQNCILGRIREVYPTTSVLIAVTDARCKIPAVCASSHAEGIYMGGNRPDSASLRFVSHLCAVQEGELALSSGEGKVYPEGYGIGRVTHSELDARRLYYTVDIVPLIDPVTTRSCTLIRKECAATENNC